MSLPGSSDAIAMHARGEFEAYDVLYEGVWRAVEYAARAEDVRELILSGTYTEQETPPGRYRVVGPKLQALDFIKPEAEEW